MTKDEPMTDSEREAMEYMRKGRLQVLAYFDECPPAVSKWQIIKWLELKGLKQ